MVFHRQYGHCLESFPELAHLPYLGIDNNLQAGWVEGGCTGVVGEHVKGVHAARGPRVPQRGPVQQQLSRGAEAQALRVTSAPAWTTCSRRLRRCCLLAIEHALCQGCTALGTMPHSVKSDVAVGVSMPCGLQALQHITTGD